MTATERATQRRLEELRARAVHARQRYHLYKARAYGPRPTSAARLRELERETELADAVLHQAETDARAHQLGTGAREPGARDARGG